MDMVMLVSGAVTGAVIFYMGQRLSGIAKAQLNILHSRIASIHDRIDSLLGKH